MPKRCRIRVYIYILILQPLDFRFWCARCLFQYLYIYIYINIHVYMYICLFNLFKNKKISNIKWGERRGRSRLDITFSDFWYLYINIMYIYIYTYIYVYSIYYTYMCIHIYRGGKTGSSWLDILSVWKHYRKTKEFQTQLLHYFSKSDNKSNHHHLLRLWNTQKIHDFVTRAASPTW